MNVMFGKHKIKSGVLPKHIDELQFTERIKILADLAGKTDLKYQIFGSERHKYKFNPTIDMQAVTAFEKVTGIALPNEYIQFLTKVGNGGAGIDYGLYALEDVQSEFKEESVSDGLTLFDYDEPCKIYYKTALEMDSLDKQNDNGAIEKYDELFADIIRGMLVIGTAGCTYDYFIMCKGKKKGYVGMVDWNMLSREDDSPILFDMTFSEWIEDYFKRIILGKVVWNGFFYTVDHKKHI